MASEGAGGNEPAAAERPSPRKSGSRSPQICEFTRLQPQGAVWASDFSDHGGSPRVGGYSALGEAAEPMLRGGVLTELQVIRGQGDELRLRLTDMEDRIAEVESQQKGTSAAIAVSLRAQAEEQVERHSVGSSSSKLRIDVLEATCRDLSRGIQDGLLGPGSVKEEINKLQREFETDKQHHANRTGQLEQASLWLSQHLEETSQSWAGIQKEQLAETSTLRSQLSEAMADFAQQSSRTDVLQELLKEEQSARAAEAAMLRARVDAVEQLLVVSPDTQPTNIAARIGAMEAEAGKEAAQLRGELRSECDKVERATAGLDEAFRRFREEFVLAQAKVEHVSTNFQKVEATCGMLVQRMAMRQPGQQSGGDAREDRPEGGAKALDPTVCARLEVVESSCRTLQSDLARRLEESDKRIREIREEQHDYMSHCISEKVTSIIEQKLSKDVKWLDQRTASEGSQAPATGTLGSTRCEDFDTDEKSSSHTVRMEHPTDAQARPESGEHRLSGALYDRLQMLEQRIDDILISRSRSPQDDTLPGTEATAINSVVDELCNTITLTNGNLRHLAQELATVKEEHDTAISGIGGLTEMVAKTAVTSLKASEERLSAEIAATRGDLERAAAAGQQALYAQTQAMIGEIADRSGAGSGVIIKPGEFDQEINERIHIALSELRTETTSRVVAAERSLVADLDRVRREVSACTKQVQLVQSDVADFKPRISALESSAPSSQNHRLSVSPVRPVVAEAKPVPTPASISDGRDGRVTGSCAVSTGQAPVRVHATSPIRTLEKDCLRGKLEGIAQSVHQVLDGLDRMPGARRDHHAPPAVMSSVRPLTPRSVPYAQEIPSRTPDTSLRSSTPALFTSGGAAPAMHGPAGAQGGVQRAAPVRTFDSPSPARTKSQAVLPAREVVAGGSMGLLPTGGQKTQAWQLQRQHLQQQQKEQQTLATSMFQEERRGIHMMSGGPPNTRHSWGGPSKPSQVRAAISARDSLGSAREDSAKGGYPSSGTQSPPRATRVSLGSANVQPKMDMPSPRGQIKSARPGSVQPPPPQQQQWPLQ